MARIYIEIAAFFFYLFIVLINRTLHLKVVGEENLSRLKTAGKNIVFIFWHQATFIPLYHYRRRRACILTMKHTRGEILARTAEKLGYQVTRLEKEDDSVGTRQFLKLVQEGYDCNLAVDGPEGPLFKLKPGAIYLAKKLGNPILPVAVDARPKLVLKWRWDKYFIPLPFARAVIIFGEPVYPGDESIENLKKKLEGLLISLSWPPTDSKHF